MRTRNLVVSVAGSILWIGLLTGCATSSPNRGVDVDAAPAIEFELAGGVSPGPTDVVVGPRLVHTMPPAYPPSLRGSGASGDTRTRALVTRDGRAEPREVLSATDPLFAEAAAEAIRSWRYAPATVNGESVESWIVVGLSFRLADIRVPARRSGG